MTITHPEDHLIVKWWDEMPEELTSLSPYVVNRLTSAGYTTAEQLREAGPVELLKIPGMGVVALEEVKTWLRELDGRPE
jgi:predicted acyltransferase